MRETFHGVYRDCPVFLTGHTGFKGSWLSLWLSRLGAEVTGYARAPVTEPNHFGLLDTGIRSVIGDVLDQQVLGRAMDEAQPAVVFHFAAQPLVRLSYEDPVETYRTNVLGTLNVCEAARRCASVRAVVAVTTDKVYENREWEWGYRETDRLGGFDPYSASKACAEILLAGYRDSFWNVRKHGSEHHVLLATVRAGNVIGGGDWSADRLIPDIMKATAAGETTTIRNPSSTRPWQHVLDCLSGYLMVGEKLLDGNSAFASSFNFGPADCDVVAVGGIADMVSAHWPAARFALADSPSGPHEARCLKLDCSRAAAALGWEPVWHVEQAIARTVGWYRRFYEHGAVGSGGDLERYIDDAREGGARWTA